MLIVYEYVGSQTLVLAGEGKWIKIKPGDNIIVAKHIECRNCSKCNGRAIIIDPPLSQDVCFLQNKTDDTVPLIKLWEVSSTKNVPKPIGRFIRPYEDKIE